MKYLRIVLPVTFLLFVSCKKDGKDKINAKFITPTDALGNIMGTADPTDWRFDDQWSSEELALFNFADTVNTTGLLQADTVSAIAYPNPATDIIRFNFASNKSTLVKLVITDEGLHTLLKHHQRLIRNNQFFAILNLQVDLTTNGFHAGNYYRIYYALYSEGGIMYKKGHGDFKSN